MLVMFGRLIHNKKSILAGVLLLIISSYCVNTTMFYHQHTIDGEVVYHSHFYSQSHTDSSEDGGHTIQMIKLIAELSNFVSEEQSFVSHLEAFTFALEIPQGQFCTSQVALFIEGVRSLRAPPVLG